MRDSYLIIRRLLRTEKAAKLQEKGRKYFFDVAMDSNKIEIRQAVQSIYKVKVAKVNTHVVAGKPKTIRRDKGWTSDWKKAVVTLQDGQKIDWAQS